MIDSNTRAPQRSTHHGARARHDLGGLSFGADLAEASPLPELLAGVHLLERREATTPRDNNATRRETIVRRCQRQANLRQGAIAPRAARKEHKKSKLQVRETTDTRRQGDKHRNQSCVTTRHRPTPNTKPALLARENVRTRDDTSCL